MAQSTRPTAITLNRKDQPQPFLEIQWSNGTTCQYPLSHLREACPCVECRGGHQFMGMKYAPDNILSLTPPRVLMMSPAFSPSVTTPFSHSGMMDIQQDFTHGSTFYTFVRTTWKLTKIESALNDFRSKLIEY